MLRFRIQPLLLAREELEGRSISFAEVSRATGVSQSVLSNPNSPRGGATTNTRFIEALIRYFRCTPNDLIELNPPLGEEVGPHVDLLYLTTT